MGSFNKEFEAKPRLSYENLCVHIALAMAALWRDLSTALSLHTRSFSDR